MAENTFSNAELLVALNTGTDRQYSLPINPSSRVSFFIRYPREALSLVDDIRPGFSMRRLNRPIGPEILLAGVHLNSKLYASDEQQDDDAKVISERIRSREQELGHQRTILIGDFNMHPFQKGIFGAQGFHAVMDRRVVSASHRVINDLEYPFMYNPMWSLFGDHSGRAPASYYFRDSTYHCHFWNMFDQVLMRPSLMPYFDERNLKMPTSDGVINFLNDRNVPDHEISDHLPLVLSLDI